METTTSTQEHTQSENITPPESALLQNEQDEYSQEDIHQSPDNRVEYYNQEPFTTLKQVYDVDGLSALRLALNEAGDSARQAAGSGLKARFAEKKAREEVIERYLGGSGLSKDAHDYKRIYADVQKFSVIPDHDWYRGDANEEGERAVSFQSRLSVGTHLERRIAEANIDTTTSEDGVEEELAADLNAGNDSVPLEAIDPFIESSEAHLDTLRTKMATLSAKRQQRLFTLSGGKLSREYEALQNEYNEHIQKLGKVKLAETLEDESLSATEKNATVIAFLFDEQARLREESLEQIKDSKVSKVIEWMNRGNVATRIAKGALIGVSAAAVGTAIGAAAGVAGVAAIGAGSAALITGAARFGRGFARSDAKKGRGLQELDESHKEKALDYIGADARAEREHTALLGLEEVESTGDAKDAADFESAQTYFNSQLEKDTSNEQRKRRRSAAAGLGGIALGAGVGFAAHALIDSGLTDGWMNRTVSGDVHAASPKPEVSTEPQETPFTGDDVKEIVDQQDGEMRPEPEAPEIMADPSFAIEPGEGGIAFFQSLGLSEADWYSVHQDLLNNFPQDFYSEYGDTRIAHSGQLSLEAQQYIKTRFGL
ncbi:hypothetical protein KI440_03455 [Candidatus Saccharibacteria bacterium TM7i]|nr:hypothetical protein KI440_03455 [Candidatus Saccharibacteria bacterium TM7i]